MYVPQILILLLLYLLEVEKRIFCKLYFNYVFIILFMQRNRASASRNVFDEMGLLAPKSVYTYVVLSHLVCETPHPTSPSLSQHLFQNINQIQWYNFKSISWWCSTWSRAAFSPHRHYMLIRSPTYNHLNAHKKYLCLTYYRQLSLFFFNHSMHGNYRERNIQNFT